MYIQQGQVLEMVHTSLIEFKRFSSTIKVGVRNHETFELPREHAHQLMG